MQKMADCYYESPYRDDISYQEYKALYETKAPTSWHPANLVGWALAVSWLAWMRVAVGTWTMFEFLSRGFSDPGQK